MVVIAIIASTDVVSECSLGYRINQVSVSQSYPKLKPIFLISFPCRLTEMKGWLISKYSVSYLV